MSWYEIIDDIEGMANKKDNIQNIVFKMNVTVV